MYTEVLEEVEQFINVTWQHFTNVVTQDMCISVSLVAEACEAYHLWQRHARFIESASIFWVIFSIAN